MPELSPRKAARGFGLGMRPGTNALDRRVSIISGYIHHVKVYAVINMGRIATVGANRRFLGVFME
jgi:hypothetical protein